MCLYSVDRLNEWRKRVRVCVAGGTSGPNRTNSDASFEWRDSEDRATDAVYAGLTNSRVRYSDGTTRVMFSSSLFLLISFFLPFFSSSYRELRSTRTR